MRILLTGALGQLGMALQFSLDKHDVIPLRKDDLNIADFEQVRTVVEGRAWIVF